MLLMDQVYQTGQQVDGGSFRPSAMPLMRIYADLANRLQPKKGPPPQRFLFDQKAIVTATELTLGRPKVFREVLRHIRLPYPACWIEWEDAGRTALREKFEQPPELDEIRPLPERMGFLVEATDDTYRRGRITWAWCRKKTIADDIPNVSGITTHFDLDGDYPIDFVDKHPLELAKLWADNPVQEREFTSIWRTAYHQADEDAIAPIATNAFLRAILFADVVGEYIMTWACLMVLLDTRRSRNPNSAGVILRGVDMSRLNRNRLKNGKFPLLDHRTVHIAPALRPILTRAPLDYRRKSPRIHLVSSYLGWHGNIVFPYTCGFGD
jgi:hypothetical protein